MYRYVLVVLFVISLGGAVPPFAGAAPSPSAKVVFQSLPKPGVKVPLNGGSYFTYGFDKQPKLGTAIMRVEIFSRAGKRDTSFVVKGSADMPSMRGAHSTDDKEFSLSAKGVYLFPVQLVMPGDWEVRFTFMKKGQVIFRGAYLFDL
jgi:hypothetical protein